MGGATNRRGDILGGRRRSGKTEMPRAGQEGTVGGGLVIGVTLRAGMFPFLFLCADLGRGTQLQQEESYIDPAERSAAACLASDWARRGTRPDQRSF